MNDVRAKITNALLDGALRQQPRRDRRDTHSVGNRVDNGGAESAPMSAAHDKHDIMLGRLNAREFGCIAFGSGKAAGEYDVHDAHR
jgi:hypothetical protein